MKRYLFLVPVLFLVAAVINAQSTASPVQQMDSAIKALAGDMNKKLMEQKVQKLALGQFTYRDSIVPLGDYWANQLSEELANVPGRSFIILSGGAAGADWMVSGQIVDAAGTIRVYTRLVRLSDRSIAAAFHSDLERNASIIAMLSSGDSRGERSSYVPMDEYESDSWDSPVPYEIGADNGVPPINRTIHDRNDEDFFLLIPAKVGLLVMETTGSTDTCMQFYNADTRELLDEDDDGGSGYNARISYSVQAGTRYIAKVKGYDSSDTGSYGFRAYFQD